MADESKLQIADYAATAGAGRAGVRAVSGQQAGDPVRAVEAIIQAVEVANPPHHLLLGNAAYAGAMAKLGELKRDFSKWEAVSRGADFPQDDGPKATTHRADGRNHRDKPGGMRQKQASGHDGTLRVGLNRSWYKVAEGTGLTASVRLRDN